MDISQRILARKIVFSYYYMRLTSEHIRDEYVPTASTTQLTDGDFSIEIDMGESEGSDLYRSHRCDDTTRLEDIYHIMQYGFETTTAEVDDDYINQMTLHYVDYRSQIALLLQSFMTNFWFDEMDSTKQSLLLIGVVEYHILHSPIQVILNETVELAKRYATEETYKGINGILHAYFQSLTPVI